MARKRDETEYDAFRALLETAMTRVLAEAAWGKKAYPTLLAQKAGSSTEAFAVRHCITKGAFAELRNACVRLGGPWTREFLDLEAEIDNFAAQWEDRGANAGVLIRMGKHAGLGDQLDAIENKAFTLREKVIRDRYGEPPWRSGPLTPNAAPPGP